MEADRMVWGGVFTYCDLHTLTESCACVCRRWRTGVHRRLVEGVYISTKTSRDVDRFLAYNKKMVFVCGGGGGGGGSGPIRVVGLTTSIVALSIWLQAASVSLHTLTSLDIDRYTYHTFRRSASATEPERTAEEIVSEVWSNAPFLCHLSWSLRNDSLVTHLSRSSSLVSVHNVFSFPALMATDIPTRLCHLEMECPCILSPAHTWDFYWPVLQTLVLRDVRILVGNKNDKRMTFLHRAPSLVSLDLLDCSFEVDMDDSLTTTPSDRVLELRPPACLRSLRLEGDTTSFSEEEGLLRLQLRSPLLPLIFLDTRLSRLDYYLPITLTDLHLELDHPTTHVFGILPCLLRLRLVDNSSYEDTCDGETCPCLSYRLDFRGCVASPFLRECHLDLTHSSTRNAAVFALLERTHSPCVVVPRFYDFARVRDKKHNSVLYKDKGVADKSLSSSLCLDDPSVRDDEKVTTKTMMTTKSSHGRWCHYEGYVNRIEYAWPGDTNTPPLHLHKDLSSRLYGIGTCTFRDTWTLPSSLYSLLQRGYILVTSVDTIQNACPTNGVQCLCTLIPTPP